MGEGAIHDLGFEAGDSDKPFDLADFKGPNLSEDEEDSDAELSGDLAGELTGNLTGVESKGLKTLSPIVLSDEDIETNPDKIQFNLDLNGHENYFDRINSPDMANYENLLQGIF